MKSEEKKAGPDDVTMRMLAPALREDFQLINETKGALASFGRIDTDVLLLGGSKSPAYLRHASTRSRTCCPMRRGSSWPASITEVPPSETASPRWWPMLCVVSSCRRR